MSCAKTRWADRDAVHIRNHVFEREAPAAEGVSAETLNNLSVLISTDADYTTVLRKCSAKPAKDDYFSEW